MRVLANTLGRALSMASNVPHVRMTTCVRWRTSCGPDQSEPAAESETTATVQVER